MGLKVIITGASGMVGEGVLMECLEHPHVESVLVIGRRPCGIEHPRLKEILHQDFSDFSAIREELKGYDAAYLNMGVSSLGLDEEKFTHLTYDLTMALAKPLAELNPDMTLTYVSGAGTDSSEKGRSMWARVKGRTENHLLAMPFKQAFMFRPGGIIASKGQNNIKTVYKILAPILPIFNTLMPKMVSTAKDIGLAMINATLYGYDKQVIEVVDIKQLAKSNT